MASLSAAPGSDEGGDGEEEEEEEGEGFCLDVMEKGGKGWRLLVVLVIRKRMEGGREG